MANRVCARSHSVTADIHIMFNTYHLVQQQLRQSEVTWTEVKGQRAEVCQTHLRGHRWKQISNVNISSHGNEQAIIIIVQKGKQSVIFSMLDATTL